jgi:hypothetical protein
MTIQGLRTAENFATNQRPENWRETMLLLYPNADFPLTALTSMMKSESTNDPVFHWFTKSLNDRRLKLNEDLDDSETEITIDGSVNSGVSVKAGDMLLIEQTGEIVRVTTDGTLNSIPVVTRAQADTTATAVTLATSNPWISVIGSAFEEGSTAPSGVNFDPVDYSNYTQIFRSTLEMTRTASKTRLRTGDSVKEAKRECLEYFGIDMERAFWFNGNKKLLTINSKPARLTSGIIYQIPAANKIAAPSGGLITLEWLEARMEEVFRFGSSEKMMFASNKVLLAFSQAVRKNTTYMVKGGEKEFGMNVTRFVTPFGELVFKTHPLFNQMAGGTASDGTTTYTGMANNAVILDMKNIRYRYVDDVKYEKDLTAIGLDGMKSGYIAECGLELQHPTTHFEWTGITGGDRDPG